MKFGICGYGNIGKAVEKLIIEQQKDEIVGIFSRRKVKSKFGTPTYSYEEAKNFSIDVMLMCGGSQEDLLWQSPEMLEHFNIVDTFDTHKKIPEHIITSFKIYMLGNFKLLLIL